MSCLPLPVRVPPPLPTLPLFPDVSRDARERVGVNLGNKTEKAEPGQVNNPCRLSVRLNIGGEGRQDCLRQLGDKSRNEFGDSRSHA
jgi:hypothetical protein